MTDREKLIALIANGVACPDDRDPFGEYCDSCRYEKSADCSNERLADHLIAHGVTVQGWIPVEERLPENDYGKHWKDRNYYIVRYAPSGLMSVAHYGYKEYDWWIDNHDCVMSATNFKEATHWMPLPPAPEDLK